MYATQATPAQASGNDPLRLAQIQGMVLRGYSYFTIRHFIFRIEDVAGARAFCGALCPGGGGALAITTAEPWGRPAPAYCLNLGITNTGLKTLIGEAQYSSVYNNSYSLFASFDLGASAPGTALTVGDTGTSDPGNWWPEENCRLPAPLGPDDMHLLISLFTRSPADRDLFSERLLAMIPNGAGGGPSLVPAFVQDADPLPPPPPGCSHSGLQIHFGYADGFSQPRIAGAPGDDPGEDAPCVPAANFVIANDGIDYDPPHPLLIDGSFSAFRLLDQDVGAFERYLAGSGVDPELLAAKMCGRWRDGTPLEVSPDKPDLALSPLDIVNFDYLTPSAHQKGPRQADDLGRLCPYAAHTRRANPRDDAAVTGNADPNDGTPLYAVQHRIRRFATPYGPEYSPGTDDTPRGLVGHFMGANLAEQFEFLMSTWIIQGYFRQPDASPNGSGIDPLFGPQPTDNADFGYLPDGSNRYEIVPSMSRFIVTRGGLYLFLPSIAALGAIATNQIPQPPSPA